MKQLSIRKHWTREMWILAAGAFLTICVVFYVVLH